MGCTNVPNDRDDKLLKQAREGKFSQPDPEMLKEVMPEVNKELEKFNKDFDEKWKEMEKEFPKPEEIFEVKVEKLVKPAITKEIWKPDKFDKEGFGPIIQEPPYPKSVFGDIQEEEKDEIKEKEGERILAEYSPSKKTVTYYKTRTEEEIKQKERQLRESLRVDFKDRITPEEKAIIKELGIAKDIEKIQRENWIKKGKKIHESAHHLENSPKIFTPYQIAKWGKIYEECKKTNRFISNYASNREEFFAENYRMFFTQPEKVKEANPMAYRELEKIVNWLTQVQYFEEMREE